MNGFDRAFGHGVGHGWGDADEYDDEYDSEEDDEDVEFSDDERPHDGVFPVDGLTFWDRTAAALRSAPAAAAPAVSTAAAGASQ